MQTFHSIGTTTDWIVMVVYFIALFYRHHAFRQLFRPIYEEYIRFLFWWTKIFLVVNYHVDRSDRCREP